jgi:D-alanyl-D-alanine carboxypeptidase (penicillin-binding protein 5/6)
LGLIPGQKFKLGELIEAALIPSANDAADALALFDAGTIDGFNGKMNDLITDWGISDSRFTSASGLNETGQAVSALSLAKLAKLAITNQTIAQTVSQSLGIVTDLSGTSYRVTSTNRLLSDPRVKGIKTGFTPAAGQSLVVLAMIRGRPVITVMLNSPDRFGETLNLIDWVERTYQWQ